MRETKAFSVLTAIVCVVFLCVITGGILCNAVPPISEDHNTYIAKLEKKPKEKAYNLTESEIYLVAQVVMLEAGGESAEMQRAVTEVIFNRLSCEVWGKTISDVIYAPGQFSVVPYISDRVVPPNEILKIVRDVCENGCTEIEKRVLFFRTNHYHSWYGAIPEFNIGNVYFSSSIWVPVK